MSYIETIIPEKAYTKIVFRTLKDVSVLNQIKTFLKNLLEVAKP